MNRRDDKDDRGTRLAEALRANLRRRKAQARDRRDAAPGRDEGAPEENGQGGTTAAGKDGSGKAPRE